MVRLHRASGLHGAGCMHVYGDLSCFVYMYIYTDRSIELDMIAGLNQIHSIFDAELLIGYRSDG